MQNDTSVSEPVTTQTKDLLNLFGPVPSGSVLQPLDFSSSVTTVPVVPWISLSAPQSEIESLTQQAREGLVPQISSEKYWKEFSHFRKFCEDHDFSDMTKVTSDTVLGWLKYVEKDFAPSSLKTKLSCVKSILQSQFDNKSSFKSCQKFIERKLVDYTPKKAKIFQTKDLFNFCEKADNATHLRTKVSVIFGMYGGFRAEDFPCLRHDEMHRGSQSYIRLFKGPKEERLLEVRHWKGKSKKHASFVIDYQIGIDLILEYKEMTKKKHKEKGAFFWQIRKTKKGIPYVHGQPLGKSNFYEYPKEIAKWLNLDDIQLYSGHSIRRSAATAAADNGMSTVQLQQWGHWKQAKTSMGYVEESRTTKIKASRFISGKEGKQEVDCDEPPTKKRRVLNDKLGFDGATFSHCTFNFGP